jgi:hypothetical protein
MRTTTYKCDRCERTSTVEREIDLKRVEVGVGHYYSDYSRRGYKEWCRTCRIETGIEQPDVKLPEINPIDPLPTLEDLIREIVREEIQNT